MKKVLYFSIILLLVLISWSENLFSETTAVAPSSGDGSSVNPYQIANLANLRWLSETSTYWASGIYFIQSANIDATETSIWNYESGFSPIGNEDNKFQGNYNGQNHIISNLTIHRASINDVGLFGYVNNNSTISNLGLVDVNVFGNALYLGALVGLGENCDVSNCFSTGSVTGSSRVGGLIGQISTGSETNCYSTASVNGTDFIGGLVGENLSATMVNCYSAGVVNGATSNIGGLLGYSGSSSTTSSYWDINTSNQSSSADGTGESTSAMKTQATYTGWDFEIIWSIDGSGIINNGYPYLTGFQASMPGANNALSFDGIDDYVSMNDFNLGTGDFTIEMWIKPNSNSNVRLIGNRDYEGYASGTWYTLHLVNDYLQLELSDDGNSNYAVLQTPECISLNKWNHIAVVRQNNTFNFYINGINITYSIVDGTPNNNNISKTGYYTYLGPYSGLIDELAVFSMALSQVEIINAMNNGYTDTQSEMVAYYKFNQGIAGGDNPGLNTLFDFLGTYNGTLNNFALSGNTSNWVTGFDKSSVTYTTSVSTNALSLDPTGTGSVTFDITSNTSWSVAKSGSWVNVNPASGTGNATITIMAAQNTTGDTRNAALVISGTGVANDKTVKISQNGIQNNCLSFDGVDDAIDINQDFSLGTNDFTIEFWAKVNALPNNSENLSVFLTNRGNNWGVDGNWFRIGYNNLSKAYIEMGFHNTDHVTYTSNAIINLGVWCHYALTRQGNNFKLYLNGNLDGSFTSPTTETLSEYYGNIPTMGGWHYTLDGHPNYRDLLNGSMDEVRIWNTNRGQTAIQNAMFTSLSGTATSGLISYYNFNQGTAGGNNSEVTTLTDYMGIFNGTLQNFSLTGSSSNWVNADWLFANGSGTISNPYQIYTPDQLNMVRNSLSSSYILMNDLNMSSYSNFIPIGNYTDQFTGTFDGNGHAISNLTINQPAANYVGLFGYLGNYGIVKNLGIASGTITGNSFVGGISSYATYSNYYNVAPYNKIPNSSGQIDHCFNNATVSGYSFVGGLAGDNEGLITNCYNSGIITGNSYYAGGIAGQQNSEGTIMYSYNK